MNRNVKLFKGMVFVLMLLAAGFLVIDNFVFDPSRGLVTRGELKLSWDAPTENVNDQTLANLAGYKIHCWNGVSRETQSITIDDPAINTYQIDRLRPGTYRCALSAFSSDGSQSALSNVVTKTVY